MKSTPNKIMVIGCCGAGKSTLSFKLAEHFDLPVYHLDRLFWKSGWVQTEKEEWVAKHGEIIQKPQWLIDGNYGSTITERLENADLILCMDMPRWRCVCGIFTRWWQHRGKTRPDMTAGCNERINWEFFKFVWNFHRDSRPAIMEKLDAVKAKKTIHIFTDRKQVEKFIEDLLGTK